jgi:hypothetical protein
MAVTDIIDDTSSAVKEGRADSVDEGQSRKLGGAEADLVSSHGNTPCCNLHEHMLFESDETTYRMARR